MPYEIFERKTPRLGMPTIRFTRIGGITFNQSAARLLQKEAIDTVLILWDAQAGKLALKTTSNKKDVRAYTLRYNPNGNGATFSAKTFLDHAGIDYENAKAIPVTINSNSEYFVEVEVPSAILKREGTLAFSK